MSETKQLDMRYLTYKNALSNSIDEIFRDYTEQIKYAEGHLEQDCDCDLVLQVVFDLGGAWIELSNSQYLQTPYGSNRVNIMACASYIYDKEELHERILEELELVVYQ